MKSHERLRDFYFVPKDEKSLVEIKIDVNKLHVVNQVSDYQRAVLRGLLHDDNFIKAARPAKAAKPPDNFYFVL